MKTATYAAVLLLAPLLGCGESTPTDKVLLIGIDGVRVDVMAEVETPTLDSLIDGGAFSDRARAALPTVSGPNWSSMLTGVWPEKHGVHNNNFAGNRYAEYPDFLTRLERVDSSFNTFAVVDWPPLGSDDSGGPLVSPRVDRVVLFDGEANGYRQADSLSVLAAVEHLEREDPDAAFVYLGNVDVVGHETSSLAPEYRRSIEEADAQVAQLLAALRRRPTYGAENWLVLVSTDHGRNDAGGHGGESEMERTIFFLASGSSVAQTELSGPPGIVDVAVTALAHLGVTADPAWQLDGAVAGLEAAR